MIHGRPEAITKRKLCRDMHSLSAFNIIPQLPQIIKQNACLKLFGQRKNARDTVSKSYITFTKGLLCFSRSSFMI